MSRKYSFGKTGFVLLFLSVLLSGISAQTLYSFDDLMNLMENNNAELQKAKQDFVQSTLDVKDAKAGFFPQAVLTAAGTYMFNPMMDDISINVDELLSGISWPGGLKPEPTGQYLKLYDG
ncbi:MAG TPA: TolC family protein, partial [Treponemataceae bacterium]|nr:TolC family protein [Treponemataceae bacterium]